MSRYVTFITPKCHLHYTPFLCYTVLCRRRTREHQAILPGVFLMPFDKRQHDDQPRGGLIMGVASKAQIDGKEQIQRLLLSSLVPFKDHPFRVVDDDWMKETVESIQE